MEAFHGERGEEFRIDVIKANILRSGLREAYVREPKEHREQEILAEYGEQSPDPWSGGPERRLLMFRVPKNGWIRGKDAQANRAFWQSIRRFPH